ncbi:DUF2480 family protein [Anditalea andensis]|uniref:DUF2480 family protein n=1 Tax=Anditalea andensis TaxID=1048983 RepID=A0A074LDY8_9BACT|nr:DUF2480 family protein [Anditalea andensis]KEO72002.1 hypothetical protein EL17_18970 [Anditalea andensis]
MSEIVNRIANSSIATIDLEEFYPAGDRIVFDLKDYLYMELVLKEMDFRKALKELDWSLYKGKYVAVHCSVDAIVPTWAYMLVTAYLDEVAAAYAVGDKDALEQFLFHEALNKINPDDYVNRPVVVKGCSDVAVPLFAYGEIIRRLKGVAKSIMFGEPCSTVPIYKRSKA